MKNEASLVSFHLQPNGSPNQFYLFSLTHKNFHTRALEALARAQQRRSQSQAPVKPAVGVIFTHVCWGCRSPRLIEPLEGICYLNLLSPRYISKPQMSEEIATRRRRNPLAVVVLCKCVGGLPALAISTSCALTRNFEASQSASSEREREMHRESLSCLTVDVCGIKE